jgi:hypothetical protein
MPDGLPSNLCVLVPADNLTLTDKTNYRMRAVRRAMDRAIGLKIITNEAGAVVRHAQPILDFGTAIDSWLTAALAAVGTDYTCFQAVAAPTLAANKVAVFYSVTVETIPPPVSLLTFRLGGATGNVIGQFWLESLYVMQNLEGYFSEPQVIDPTQPFAVQVRCRTATNAAARVALGCYIVEPAGQTISIQT